MNSVPGHLMSAEITSQPASVARFLDHGLADAISIGARIRRFRPRAVVIAGRGTSDHAALYAKYLIELLTGLPVGLVSCSTASVFEVTPSYERVLWLGFSQSGQSPDLLEHAARAAAGGALTVSLTNTPGSALAAITHHHLNIHAGPELAVAATKTYTNQLIAAWALIRAWTGGDLSALTALPDQINSVLSHSDLTKLVDLVVEAPFTVLTGRGLSYPTAREAALKLMETGYQPALAFSGADLLHGPIAILGTGVPVLVVVGFDASAAALTPVLSAARATAASVCVIGDITATQGHEARVGVRRAEDPLLDPVLQILPLQLLACAASIGRGFDPDAPRALSKVTRTR